MPGRANHKARARLLTLREAAALLGVHPNTVRAQVRRGALPGAKIGRDWRFLEEDLIARLREGYRDPRAVASHPAGLRDEVGRPGDPALSGLQENVEAKLDALLASASESRRR